MIRRCMVDHVDRDGVVHICDGDDVTPVAHLGGYDAEHATLGDFVMVRYEPVLVIGAGP